MYEEPKMEKMTINLPPMELARMDILVEAGYYPSRTEFIRAAIRTQLDNHQDFIAKRMTALEVPLQVPFVEEQLTTGISGVGVIDISKETFEKAIEQGKLLKIRVVGMLHIGKGVTPAHIKQAVASAKVYGILRASPQVKAALERLMKDRGGE